MTKTKLILLPALILIECLSFFANGISVSVMTCEKMVNPVVVSTNSPEFGWEMVSELQGDFQKAYEIKVSSDKQLLAEGKADMWSTGKVKSGQSQLVKYEGKKLLSGHKYFWSVTVWDSKGKKSSSSDISCFMIAPSNGDLRASWIGAIKRSRSNLPDGRRWHVPSFQNRVVSNTWNSIDSLALRSILLRKDVDLVDKPVSAIAYVSGLGHFELSVNGSKVGQSYFDPMWSDYDKTVYYKTFDLTSLLQSGNNAIGVMLGNGFYNCVGNRYSKLWVSFGPPTLFFKLDLRYADGSTKTVISDGSWKYSLSPLTYNDIFGGESYDAGLEQDGWNKPGFKENNKWKAVVLQDAPTGMLRPQTAPDIKIMKEYAVKEVKKLDEGVYVLDMGQNISGFPYVKIKGKRGDKVRLIPGEILDGEGRVSQRSSGGPHYYEYILKGDVEEILEPKFVYYGFQYIQIEGADLYNAGNNSVRPVISEVKSKFVYNSAEETGTFTCSNDLYNKTHVLIQNAVKSNFQSVFTDCPHREKLGWLEQLHLNYSAIFDNYNLSTYIPKTVRDMLDAQYSNGLVPSICPEYTVFGGDFSDSPEWGISSIMVPWSYYEYYGDPSLIKKSYQMMKRYVDFLTSRSDSGIVSHGLGDWYDYGTHNAGYAKNSPIAISATSHYYFAIKNFVKTAEFLGKTTDAQNYSKLMCYVKNAYNKRFFNAETKQYATGSQFSNAVSIFMDLVEPQYREAVLKNLVSSIKSNGNRLTTGDIGNRYLFQVLAQNGYNDIMFDMTNHYEAPGYGYQISLGATTLAEQWDPKRGNSRNHFMMAQIEEWFFRNLAGIQTDITQPGFKHFYVKPVPAGDLTFVEATHKCLYGLIKVSWKKIDGEFQLNVDVPVNTTATVMMPFKSDYISLNGKNLKLNNNIVNIKSGSNIIILRNNIN
jgi:hypothetical protein